MRPYPFDLVHFTALDALAAGHRPESARTRPQDFSTDAAEIPAPRVLVADDEALLRWSLAEMLAGAGYEVIEARDGVEARRAFANPSRPLDAMLLDLKLPDTTGLLLIDDARRQKLTCPIVLMTAYGTSDTVRTALDAGVVRVVTKPFDLDDMVRFVREICPLPPR
jgi:response regulator NasT